MKRFFAASLLLLLFIAGTSSTFAQGAEAMIKNKAKGIRDANNASQGIAPAQPPPAPAAPGATAPGTAPPRGPDPAQQAKIDKLENDIMAIQPGVRVPLDQRKQIREDAAALARGAVKPSEQSLSNLVTHLSIGLAEKGVSLKDPGPAELARDINITVNSLNLSAGQVQPVIVTAQNLLRTSAVPEDDYKAVVADLKGIVAELQKNKPKP